MKVSVLATFGLMCLSSMPAQESEKPKPFFPIDKEGKKGVSVFQEQWYSKHLRRMKEEPLQQYSEDKNAQIYRFTLLPTWGNPRSVRLTKVEDDFVIKFSRLDGAGGYDPGKLVEAESAKITKEQANAFAKLFDKTKFFAEPSEDEDRGPDGSEWILEAVTGGQYHIVVRWTPKAYDLEKRGTVEFVKTCEWLLAHAPTKSGKTPDEN